MDNIVFFMHAKFLFILVFAGVLILAKFAAGFIYFNGNVVDSFVKFFRFYSISNINMTETCRQKIFKRTNNVVNIVIYLLLFLSATFYFINPEQQ